MAKVETEKEKGLSGARPAVSSLRSAQTVAVSALSLSNRAVALVFLSVLWGQEWRPGPRGDRVGSGNGVALGRVRKPVPT